MSKLEAKVLIIDDDKDVLLAAKLFLKQHFNIVHTEENPENIPNLMQHETYDVILLDMNFSRDATSGKEGFMWLNKILEIDPSDGRVQCLFVLGEHPRSAAEHVSR